MAAQELPVDGPRLFDGAILRYNCAHHYAPTVALLADQIR